ncbi:MAG: ribosomal protein S18-alanine N-acetyltransferase [bacterium]
MCEADLDRVVELERVTFAFPWHRRSFLVDCSRQRALAIVADDGGVVNGYAVVWLEGDELHVANIAVASASRRQGTGSALLAAAVEHGREKGARSCYLEVRETNVGALAFYRRHGFIITGFRRGYYPDGETAVVMERDIEPSGFVPAGG